MGWVFAGSFFLFDKVKIFIKRFINRVAGLSDWLVGFLVCCLWFLVWKDLGFFLGLLCFSQYILSLGSAVK